MTNKFPNSNIQFSKAGRLPLSLLVVAFLAVGCNNIKPAQQEQRQGQKQEQNQNQTASTPSKEPTIIVSQTVEGSDLAEQPYTIQGGEKAIDLLKRKHSVEVKSYSFGDMVIGIDGIKPDSRHFWEFFVNGKSSNVGASSYILKNGDKIEWKLEEIK